jgi:hypothetical protein
MKMHFSRLEKLLALAWFASREIVKGTGVKLPKNLFTRLMGS